MGPGAGSITMSQPRGKIRRDTSAVHEADDAPAVSAIVKLFCSISKPSQRKVAAALRTATSLDSAALNPKTGDDLNV